MKHSEENILVTLGGTCAHSNTTLNYRCFHALYSAFVGEKVGFPPKVGLPTTIRLSEGQNWNRRIHPARIPKASDANPAGGQSR